MKPVRRFLFDLQKDIAKTNHVIMDGRDIGTVVLPEAQVKIFLTASDEERAGRRYKELLEKGQQVSFEEVLKDLRERDYNDSHRETAPLKPAEDSVLPGRKGRSKMKVQKVWGVYRSATGNTRKAVKMPNIL